MPVVNENSRAHGVKNDLGVQAGRQLPGADGAHEAAGESHQPPQRSQVAAAAPLAAAAPFAAARPAPARRRRRRPRRGIKPAGLDGAGRRCSPGFPGQQLGWHPRPTVTPRLTKSSKPGSCTSPPGRPHPPTSPGPPGGAARSRAASTTDHGARGRSCATAHWRGAASSPRQRRAAVGPWRASAGLPPGAGCAVRTQSKSTSPESGLIPSQSCHIPAYPGAWW